MSIFTFALGFAVDLVTFKRVYSPQGLLTQALYLLILGTLLMMEIKAPMRGRGKWWGYHDLIVHFLFGSLLSLYTIFFYSSASALSSFLYILLLGILLIGNEFGPMRKLGLSARVLLYMICSLSYFSFLYPILLGRLGELPFWLGILSVLLILCLIWLINFRGAKELKKKVLYPALSMVILFVAGYYTSTIPPVPLAVKKMGVYHEIEKKNGKYIGRHLSLKWRPFQKEIFLVKPGDKINILLSIFSPTNFNDQIHLKWYRYSEKEGWLLEDNIPLQIVGGREEGFRGFATKEYFTDGEWKICVETTEGREIGRVNLRVLTDLSIDPRVFKTTEY